MASSSDSSSPPGEAAGVVETDAFFFFCLSSKRLAAGLSYSNGVGGLPGVTALEPAGSYRPVLSCFIDNFFWLNLIFMEIGGLIYMAIGGLVFMALGGRTTFIGTLALMKAITALFITGVLALRMLFTAGGTRAGCFTISFLDTDLYFSKATLIVRTFEPKSPLKTHVTQ
jgi:hypothetical protein